MATNKNSRIITRMDRKGQLRTETTGRDPGQLDVSITTNRRNMTRVFIDQHGRDYAAGFSTIELDGRQARTLFLALQKHYWQHPQD